jgi:biotin carboxyl carrier protein
MKYIVTINDKNYEVEVERGKATVIKTTQVAAAPLPDPVPAPVAPAAAPAAPAAQDAAVSGVPVKAPMPGTILKINVQQGDAVKKGDVLFIFEAMKMESEITASKDGVVSQIMVAKGTSVSTGDILLAMQ